MLPRERSIVEARNVVLLDVAKRKLRYRVGHDLQFAGSASARVRFVFLELDPGLLDRRLSQLHTCTRKPRINKKQRGWERVDATPADHEVIARNPEGNSNALARRLRPALSGLPAQDQLAASKIQGRKEMIEQGSPDHAVDALCAKPLRQLAQRHRRDRQVRHGPVAEGE